MGGEMITKPVRVLIVDDQPRARDSMQALLSTCPWVGEVREARNGREAIDMAGKSQPDVVLIDVRMPEIDGPRAILLMKALWPQVKIVALSMYPEHCQDALAAGADAFVAKADAWRKLLATLEELLSGDKEKQRTDNERTGQPS